MSPQTELMELMCDTVKKSLGLDISLKELPAASGLYAEPGEGFGVGMYYDKTAVRTIPVLFLCRDPDQKKCIDQLAAISNYLQRLKAYPQGKSVSWVDAQTVKEASKIGRDEDGAYHGSCIVNCQVYF